MKLKDLMKNIWWNGVILLLLLGCSLLGMPASTPVSPTSIPIPSTSTLIPSTSTPILTTVPPATPTTTSVQVEQARAFAEPILQAIANRKPDFADDYSTADKGWIGGNLEQNESAVVQNGVARLEVKEMDVSIGNQALNRKDFILNVDARVAEGDKATHLIVNFHNLSGEYWFYVVVNSAGSTWNVDKRLAGQQTNLASGQGNVSPFGEPTRITIVARGPRAAVYLNGKPVAYFEDADFDTPGNTFLFCESLGLAVCEFDNVEFWDLTKVPGLP
jgi:hypothetical protein